MHNDINAYVAAQSNELLPICERLANEIHASLPMAEAKVWHRAPVWFIDGNPIVGFWARKGYVQLLFWSGQSFAEPTLKPEGKFKAAELRLTSAEQLSSEDLEWWIKKAQAVQWDYKNIVKRKGVLEKIGSW